MSIRGIDRQEGKSGRVGSFREREGEGGGQY